jgi:hypothetical protein
MKWHGAQRERKIEAVGELPLSARTATKGPNENRQILSHGNAELMSFFTAL